MTGTEPKPTRRPALSRRHFLLAGAAVPATALLAGPAGALVRVDQHAVFTEAARAYGLPVALLAGVSYAQTRWQDHDGRPSASQGYGPMHLVDGDAARRAHARADKPAPAVLDTLGDAARATGLGKEQLRTDPAANVRGAAAIIAEQQRALGRPTGGSTDPASWYAAVAATSGLTSAQAQLDLADAALAAVRSGAALTLPDGTRLATARRAVGSPGEQRVALRDRADAARKLDPRAPQIDAPRGLDVEWLPAPYEQFGPDPGDYGNHDLAFRPKSPTIDYVVIHDTECPYDVALDLVSDPTYVSWQYTLRSSDGHIAQHLLPKDVGWHAGNWYVNSHSIGLEHEGYAAEGAPWFSEPMYRTSARLVRYLCDKYAIPKDRAHIIGHDQVPGTTTPTIPGMHWDPGPFWDWEHYFDLIGSPLDRATLGRRVRAGDVVRILPGFVGNKQPVTGCAGAGDTCGDKDTNFVTLRVAPREDAALVNDIGLHQQGQPATTYVSDHSARATAGLDFVVAEVDGDWTAIWYLGVKSWFRNPASAPTARPVAGRRRVITASGESAKTYGRCYPEPEAYADPADVQPVSPLIYTIPAGQAYVVTDESPVTDYYKAKTFSLDTPNDHVDIVGTDRYYQISLGHRLAYVRAAEVRLA